jgi:hypothetical protein
VSFQCRYRLGHRLPAYRESIGQIRCMQSTADQRDERDRLRRADPVEPSRGERRP